VRYQAGFSQLMTTNQDGGSLFHGKPSLAMADRATIAAIKDQNKQANTSLTPQPQCEI
jgi:hypothetical protein